MTKLRAEVRGDTAGGAAARTSVAVIGGGAAGMMTAATAARLGAAVTLLSARKKEGASSASQARVGAILRTTARAMNFLKMSRAIRGSCSRRLRRSVRTM